jgi:hypothetical protein
MQKVFSLQAPFNVIETTSRRLALRSPNAEGIAPNKENTQVVSNLALKQFIKKRITQQNTHKKKKTFPSLARELFSF